MRTNLEAGGKRMDRAAEATLAVFCGELEAEESRVGSFVADSGALDLEAYARWHHCTDVSDSESWAGRYDAVVILPAGTLPY